MHDSAPISDGGSGADRKQSPHGQGPVFIVGVARSGTTLLQQMLDHHPAFSIQWESLFITVFHRQVARFGDLSQIGNRLTLIRSIARYVDINWRIWRNKGQGEWLPGLEEEAPRLAEQSPPAYAGVADAILSFGARQRGCRRWGQKTPGYLDHLPVLAGLFPDAKFIHIIRDGRDVASSVLPLSFGPNTIYMAARRWRQSVQRGLTFAKEFPEKIHTMRYEDLIGDPEKHLHDICAFLGEEFFPGMLEFHKDGRQRLPQAATHTAIGKPVNKQRSGRWKKDLSPRQVRIFEAVAGPLLSELGYERTMPKAKLRPMERTLGKLGDKLLVFRPFTQPVGLRDRLRMHRDRARFQWVDGSIA